MRKTTYYVYLIITGIVVMFCGCSGATGLFGEVVYSQEDAEAVYTEIAAQIEDFCNSDCAYTIDISTIAEQYCYFRTEEYTLAYVEDGEQDVYLWYKDMLYAEKEGGVTCTELSWEDLHTEQMMSQAEDSVEWLIEQEHEEMNLKEVPMAGKDCYLLTLKYPSSVIPAEEKEVSPSLRIWVDDNTEMKKCIISWSVPMDISEDGIGSGGSLVTISFYPYENSTAELAERKLASFARAAGLAENDMLRLGDMAKRENSLQFPVYGE